MLPATFPRASLSVTVSWHLPSKADGPHTHTPRVLLSVWGCLLGCGGGAAGHLEASARESATRGALWTSRAHGSRGIDRGAWASLPSQHRAGSGQEAEGPPPPSRQQDDRLDSRGLSLAWMESSCKGLQGWSSPGGTQDCVQEAARGVGGEGGSHQHSHQHSLLGHQPVFQHGRAPQPPSCTASAPTSLRC